MTQIALATFSKIPTLNIDDQSFYQSLMQRGLQATPVAWDDPATDWAQYDAVVLRSTWDYHLRWQDFSAWMNQLETQGVTMLNPLPLVRWNLHKGYLQELQQRGVPLLPTVFLAQGEQAILSDVIAAQGWEQAVVKPVISAGGDNTWLTTVVQAQAEQHELERLLAHTGVMVQQFAPNLVAEGEWSLIFFNGEYSHAVLKKPAAGSIFVHEERGGTTAPVIPTTQIIQQAADIVQHAQHMTGILPLYVRVDGVIHDNIFTLMELECIEPELYLKHAQGAGDRFTQALLKVL